MNNNLRGRDTPPAVREITNTNKIFSRYFVPTTKSTNSNNANTSDYTRIEMTFLLLGDWILLHLWSPLIGWTKRKFHLKFLRTLKRLRILRTELTIDHHHMSYVLDEGKVKKSKEWETQEGNPIHSKVEKESLKIQSSSGWTQQEILKEESNQPKKSTKRNAVARKN